MPSAFLEPGRILHVNLGEKRIFGTPGTVLHVNLRAKCVFGASRCFLKLPKPLVPKTFVPKPLVPKPLVPIARAPKTLVLQILVLQTSVPRHNAEFSKPNQLNKVGGMPRSVKPMRPRSGRMREIRRACGPEAC